MNYRIVVLLLRTGKMKFCDAMSTARSPILPNAQSTDSFDEELVADESSRLCIPYLTCSSTTNRVINVVLGAVTIFVLCMYVNCYECVQTNKKLRDHTSNCVGHRPCESRTDAVVCSRYNLIS